MEKKNNTTIRCFPKHFAAARISIGHPAAFHYELTQEKSSLYNGILSLSCRCLFCSWDRGKHFTSVKTKRGVRGKFKTKLKLKGFCGAQTNWGALFVFNSCPTSSVSKSAIAQNKRVPKHQSCMPVQLKTHKIRHSWDQYAPQCQCSSHRLSVCYIRIAAGNDVNEYTL